MAHKETIQDADARIWIEYSFFYNLHFSVGWGNKNQIDDVFLVQFFINSWRRQNKQKLIDEDGLFGPKTSKAIRSFQKDMFSFADGVVTSIDGTRFKGTKSGTIYSIFQLNYWYITEKRLYFDDIRKDPNLPVLLAQKLSVV